MLKKPCPYHRGPTKHTLEECTILRHFYSAAPPKEDTEEKQPKDKDDDDDKGADSLRSRTVS